MRRIPLLTSQVVFRWDIVAPRERPVTITAGDANVGVSGITGPVRLSAGNGQAAVVGGSGATEVRAVPKGYAVWAGRQGPVRIEAELAVYLKVTDVTFEGTLDARSTENPFPSTVTYGVHTFHRFHTATSHFYLSRAIFLHRPSFDAWPQRLQEEMRAAVEEAIVFQRELHVKEENDAMAAIRKEGGEILELTAQEHESFVRAVARIYDEARREYGRDLPGLVGL